MRKLLLCCVLVILIVGEGFAQNLFYTKNLETSFFSEARFENIEALSKKGTSVINISTGEIAFKIPIRSFIFKNGLMQEHFNENYLESDKYPNATFTGKLMEGLDLKKDGTYNVIATGKLTVHGITKDRSIGGVIEVNKGRILVASSFDVPVQDHNINIPNDKISNISQNIKVEVKAAYEPKN
jgi:polyisoprenoid-binding protein YceI